MNIKKFIQFITEDYNNLKGGLADDASIEDLAKRHRVSIDDIKSALIKGKNVELEHTSDENLAYEIAMDHIWEDPKYYDKLAQIEEDEDSELEKTAAAYTETETCPRCGELFDDCTCEEDDYWSTQNYHRIPPGKIKKNKPKQEFKK